MSDKTLNKLISIANTQYNLKNNEARSVFRQESDIKKTHSKDLSKLINDIKKISVPNEKSFINTKIKVWIENAESILEKNIIDKCYSEKISKGSRGIVYKDGDFIVKKIKSQDMGEILHEENMCNLYNIKNGSNYSVAKIQVNCIKMPFLSGQKPNFTETIAGVRDLYHRGFMIGDPKPSNFLKCESGEIVPIDFGLIFIPDKFEDISPKVRKDIVQDYINGGHRYIPAELKTEYARCINEIHLSLGQDSLIRYTNLKKLADAGL